MKRIVISLATVVMLVMMMLPSSVPAVMGSPGLQERHQQYQNGTETKAPEWSKGDINRNNSNYAEGDSVPYRYEFKDVPADACLRFEIHYAFTKGEKYAFDFLTSVKRTETAINVFSNPQSPLTNLTEPTCNCTALAIPDDPDVHTDNLVVGAEGTQYFTICGDYVSASAESGPTLKALTKDGDNEKVITLVIKASNATPNQIAVAWGGHLAIGDTANWGVGNGSSSISGAPFHMRGEGFSDNNCNGVRDQGEAELGNGDRSIQPSAIHGQVFARISITPPDDTNVVGDPHQFIATVETYNGTDWLPFAGANVTFNVTSGPGTLDPVSASTNSSGQAKTILFSNVTGTSIVTASTTVNGFDISTDGTANNSGPAQKDWVYARISITPPEDTNLIGDPHEFTATVETSTDGITWDPYQGANVTFNVTSGPGTLDPVTDATDADGEAKTILSSNVIGTTTVEASTTVYGFDISTDGTADNSEPAQKDWVDVRISITPPEDTNLIGDPHEFIATVETYNGTDWLPFAGANVTFNVTSGPGTLDPVSASTNSSGQAKTILSSNVTGTTTVKASTTVYGFDLSTDGTANNSEPAQKDWVYARIKISPPEDTNVVGDPHEFTATVETSTDGITWDAYQGANVTFNVTSGPGTLDPVSASTNSSGQAKTTLSSNVTGTTTVKASTTVYGFDLSTDGKADNSGPAEKHWVNARISIFESGVNPVGQPHDFTVTVEKNLSAGWVPAVGVNVTGTTNFGTLTGSPATTNGSGQVTFTVNSSMAGTATVHASATVSIGDIDIDAATNGYGAYDVRNIKTWTSEPRGGGAAGCACKCGSLTVDWEGNNTTKPLYTNDCLAVDLLGPSLDLSHSLFLERGTHAPIVDEKTYYVIVVRELEEIPPVPQNTTAIVAFNITPAGAEFDRDILLTLGLNQTQLPANVLNVTMDYYDDVNEVWVPLEYEAGGPNGVAELTLSAPINHFSIYGVLAKLGPATPTQPAHFVPSGLSITPSVEEIWKSITFVTKTGETVTVTANIANDGGQSGTYNVVLKLNGQTVATETVAIGAGQSKHVSFTRSGLDYGQYDVELAGLTDEFTVSRTITWWLIILLIVAIGLIIWGVASRRRRKQRATQEQG